MEGRWHGDQAWKEGFEAPIAPSLIPELLYCFFFFPWLWGIFPPLAHLPEDLLGLHRQPGFH